MKYYIVLFVIILTLIPVVKAEDKSWYEIDGIRFRPVGANSSSPIVIYMPWKIEALDTKYNVSGGQSMIGLGLSFSVVK